MLEIDENINPCKGCPDYDEDGCKSNGGCGRPQTRADHIRSMTDEELAELIGDNIDCSICKNDVFRTTTCPRSLTADGKDCYGCWLDWLREEAE